MTKIIPFLPLLPYTVYVLTVKKGSASWVVFRRYREWEDLRTTLLQQLGSAPPMPPKALFGRMRPEVIEANPSAAGSALGPRRALTRDFLEKNTPPPGLEAALVDAAHDPGATPASADAGGGPQRQRLKELVEATEVLVPIAS
ncbi:hypothetical protein EMIHUDRAFT_202840 [Emiliania huxleyi CCMP1516]|uniref:PX domain-containing protein n=2 Tax=Emiliania huxleyi TaxID=2903 RepID=A0A0D3K8W6_EMIH1|nr:hypothetical protein EMIHUDRAFT_202840 [Emiliania huxleyi CCMP1516]EOD32201.1 hypothetical protein EMIHUDRAFT_202840 [Emiliania huxleyi CCMP1516]|eukprot:XP_005784630.1 hypothetical protein EMIHUDRAFT_202840 [Emiliania huxleyi CCMP1516]